MSLESRSKTLSPYFKGFILVFCAGIFWSFGPVVVRYMVSGHEYVFQYLFYRGISISCILMIYLFFREGFSFYKNFFKIGISGILGAIFLSTAFIGFIFSITMTSAAVTLFMLAAMPFIDSVVLLIIGFGKVEDELKELVVKMGVEDKVIFYGKVPFEDLFFYTKQADIGLLLEQPLGLSFRYALPNKLFDYIHAGLPIIASPLLEIKRIMDKNEMGVMIENYNPRYLAKTIKVMLNDAEKRKVWKANMVKVKQELNWEKESEKINNLFSYFL